MNNIPKAVLSALERLKNASQSRLSLKVINGKYYVYEESSVYLKEVHRSKALSSYLGRILDNGKFAPKRKKQTDTSRLENEVKALGGRIEWNTGAAHALSDKLAHRSGDIRVSETEMKMLKCLSMNSRMPMSRMSRIVGMSPQAAYAAVKRLEKRFDISYVTGVNTINVGYLPFIVLITFKREIPELSELASIFASEPAMIFAGVVQGKDYDVLGLILVDSAVEANVIVSKLRTSTPLKDYDSVWNLTPYLHYYGIVKHSDEFYDKVMHNKVWRRTKESPRPNPGQLLQREFVLIKELEKNGNMDFTEIDRKHGLPRGTSRHTFGLLRERSVLSRSSISINSLNIKHICVLMLKYVNMEEFNATKRKLFSHIADEKRIISRYSLIGEIGSPSSLIMFMPILDDEEFYDEVKFIRENIRGIRLKTYVMTGLFMGAIYNRRYDYSLPEDIRSHRNPFINDIPAQKERIDYG